MQKISFLATKFHKKAIYTAKITYFFALLLTPCILLNICQLQAC